MNQEDSGTGTTGTQEKPRGINYRVDARTLSPWLTLVIMLCLGLALSYVLTHLVILAVQMIGYGLIELWVNLHDLAVEEAYTPKGVHTVQLNTWASIGLCFFPLFGIAYFTLFHPTGYMASGPGHMLTVDFWGGRQIGGYQKKYWLIRHGLVFGTGAHPIAVRFARFLRGWKHGVGGNTTAMECPSAFVRIKQGEDTMLEVFSRGNKPAKILYAYLPLDPWKVVRRFDQGDVNNDLVWKNMEQTAEAVFKEALQHPSVTMFSLTSSHEFGTILNEAFRTLRDDEGNLRARQIEISGRLEWVIDTGYGYGIYNVQAQDIGPSEAIRSAMDLTTTKRLTAEAQAEAFAVVVRTLEKLNIKDSYLAQDIIAMIINGDLSGEEVKLWLGNLSFGKDRGDISDLVGALRRAGINPETIERIIGHLSRGAQAFGPGFRGDGGSKKRGNAKR